MKPPHEMTKAEYLEHGVEYVRENLVSYYPIPGATTRKPRGLSGHVYHINQAIAKGLTIPLEVQKEYPQLFEV
jgi:hypothetical protein